MSQQGQWQVAGSAPEVYERELVPAVFGPWAPIVVELAHPRPGERVVDIACGTGLVARIAAARVGPSGSVAGVDLNPGMLNVARSVATASEPSAPIHWHEASADKLPFPDSSFDIAYCQLGLQFFADRPAALREMHRVLVTEGRLALMVWRGIAESLGFQALAELLEKNIGPAAATIMRAPFGLQRAKPAGRGRWLSRYQSSSAGWEYSISFNRTICVELHCGFAVGWSCVAGKRCRTRKAKSRQCAGAGKIYQRSRVILPNSCPPTSRKGMALNVRFWPLTGIG
jgi:SAM-dependent methyltransferase